MNLLGDRLKSLIGAGGSKKKAETPEATEESAAKPSESEKAEALVKAAKPGEKSNEGEASAPKANDKGKMLLGALIKGGGSQEKEKKEKVEPAKEPVKEPQQQKASGVGPPSKAPGGAAGKEKPVPKKETKAAAEKMDTTPVVTSDGRKSYALKQLRYIGMSVFNDLTEFDCPEKVQELVSAYMVSEDKARARRNVARPIAMAWAAYDPKKMKLTAYEKQQQAGSDRGQQQQLQQQQPQQQQKKDGTTWSRGEPGAAAPKSRAEMQRLQFEKERAEILAEREKAKVANPESFVGGVRVDASYHEESDAIMAELMADEQRLQTKIETGSNPKKEKAPAWKQLQQPPESMGGLGSLLEDPAPIDAEMDAYLRERLGQGGTSLLGSLDSEGGVGSGLPESVGFDLGLKLSALSNLDSPDRGDSQGGDGDLGFFGDLGGLGDLGGGDAGDGDGGGLGSLLGGLGDLGLGDESTSDGLLGGALEEPAAQSEGVVAKEAEKETVKEDEGEMKETYEAQLRMQPAAPATPPRADGHASPAAAAAAAAATLAAMTPEQKAHRDGTIRETLHSMGVASTLYQTQLGELAAHYRHQMANSQGNVDPRLVEQINGVKHNLHQLSAHYVQFTNLVNSGAPLPQSPMRPPQTQGHPPVPPMQQQQQQQHQQQEQHQHQQQHQQQEQHQHQQQQQQQQQQQHQQATPPQRQKQQQQQQAPPAQPAGQSVNVSALFDAAKKAESAGGATEAASAAPQGTRKVNVLSMFAAAAAADKAKEPGDSNTSDSAAITSSNTSNTSSSGTGAAGGGGNFAFHSSGTTNKKKGSAISAASKMKLLQMKKKK